MERKKIWESGLIFEPSGTLATSLENPTGNYFFFISFDLKKTNM